MILGGSWFSGAFSVGHVGVQREIWTRFAQQALLWLTYIYPYIIPSLRVIDDRSVTACDAFATHVNASPVRARQYGAPLHLALPWTPRSPTASLVPATTPNTAQTIPLHPNSNSASAELVQVSGGTKHTMSRSSALGSFVESTPPGEVRSRRARPTATAVPGC
jgi:hypothetical protein